MVHLLHPMALWIVDPYIQKYMAPHNGHSHDIHYAIKVGILCLPATCTDCFTVAINNSTGNAFTLINFVMFFFQLKQKH